MEYRPPTVKEYYTLKYSTDIKTVIDVVFSIIGDSDEKNLSEFFAEYLSSVENMRKAVPDLQTPYYPDGENEKIHYHCNSQDVKIVSDYTGHDFAEVYNMIIFEFWGYLHDAVVWNLSKSQSGRDYLEKCWTHAQTEPDRTALRERYGGTGYGKK